MADDAIGPAERRSGPGDRRVGPPDRRANFRRGKGYYDRRTLDTAAPLPPEITEMRVGPADRRIATPIRRLGPTDRRAERRISEKPPGDDITRG